MTNGNLDGFGFSQVFQIANTVLNVVYDAFGKPQNTDSGRDFPGYQANIQTRDDNKKDNTTTLLIWAGLIIGTRVLIYSVRRK
jgi:hypothetical protein